MVEDSEEDDDEPSLAAKMEDVDEKDVKSLLSPEDAKFTGELADGVGRIKVYFSSNFLLRVDSNFYNSLSASTPPSR